MYNQRPPMPLKASLKRPTKQLPRPTRLSPASRTHRRAQQHLLRVALIIAGRGGVERARPLRAQPLLAALPARLNRQIPHPAAQPHLPRVPLNPAHPPQAGRLLVRHRQAPLRPSRPATNHRRVLRRPPATKAAVTAKAVGAKAEAVKAAASRLPW